MSPSQIAVERFLDDDLSVEERRRTLQVVAEDAEAVEMLRFEVRLRRALRERATDAVPAGFSDRVMDALERRAALHPPQARPPLARRRTARRLGLAAAAVCVAAVAFGAGRLSLAPAQPPEAVVAEASDQVELVTTRFVYLHDDAATVAVAGDFTQWESVELRREEREGQVIWTGVLAVPPGEHRYMFVVDGQEWVTDPFAERVTDDGFGHRNAILTV